MTGAGFSWWVLRLPLPWIPNNPGPTCIFNGSPRDTHDEWPERKAESGYPERLATHQALQVPDVWQALCCRGMEARGEMPTVWRRALLRGFAEPAIRSRRLSGKPLNRSQKSLASAKPVVTMLRFLSAIHNVELADAAFRNPANDENGGGVPQHRKYPAKRVRCEIGHAPVKHFS